MTNRLLTVVVVVVLALGGCSTVLGPDRSGVGDGAGVGDTVTWTPTPSDRLAMSPCVSPPNTADWNSTRPASAHPVQTLAGSGVVDQGDGSPPREVTYTAKRTRNSSLFPGVAHDNIMFRHNGSVYLLAQYHCSHLFRSETGDLTDPDDWTVVREGVFYPTKLPGRSVDSLIHADGRWYAYTKNWTLTSESLTGEWTRHRSPSHIDDVGAHYENGTFHLFYEAGNTTGLSGSEIGHVTSPDGVGNWTDRGTVYTGENGYKTGDYDVVEYEGLYLVFADYSRSHPNYSVALFATPSLSSNLTRVGTVARPFSNSSVQPERGIQDPTVLADPWRDQFVLFAHVHENRRRLHHATLNVSVE